MRKGVYSLYHLIQQSGKFSALKGDYFVFMGATRKSVKILWWHKNGFAMYYKRLELGCFTPPRLCGDDAFREFKASEVECMLDQVRHRSVGSELRLNVLINS